MAAKREEEESQKNEIKKENEEKSKCPRQKFQQVIENLKKKVEESESSEEVENENEEELELPEVIGVSLNLSKKNLKKFPEELLNKLHKVQLCTAHSVFKSNKSWNSKELPNNQINSESLQYLYLERNNLTELPDNFFQQLYLLKWLDLRNNSLTALPTLGLKHHACLEVILLQGNRIRNLPVELAMIPTLKGLQTTGNPITNVPYEVIAGGFQQVIKHLENLYYQDEILLPVSDTIVVKPSTSRENPQSEVNEPTDAELRMWDLEKLSQWRHFMKKKSQNQSEPSSKYYETKNVNEKPLTQQAKISVSVRSQPKLPTRPQPFRCGVYNKNRHRRTASALRYLKMRKTRLGYRRKPITLAMIQEKARNEAYRAQVREILEKQAKKIQRMRDTEILKNWRSHSRLTREQMKLLDNYQQYPSKDFAQKTPFDVDPEFLNMLNRVDLYRTLKDYDNRSKRKKKPRVRITALDLERQMNEIIKKLQQLDASDAEENSSPRVKHSHVCNKIDKIMDIQKTLKTLQTLNSSMSGIVPIMKIRPKD